MVAGFDGNHGWDNGDHGWNNGKTEQASIESPEITSGMVDTTRLTTIQRTSLIAVWQSEITSTATAISTDVDGGERIPAAGITAAGDMVA